MEENIRIERRERREGNQERVRQGEWCWGVGGGGGEDERLKGRVF